MKQETEPIQRPSTKQEITNMNDALAKMQSLQRIHFSKSLPKTAIQKGELSKYAELNLPTQFVQENGDKFEEWVILRAQLSRGKVSKPSWLVRLKVSNRASIRIGRGWHSFVAGNHLKEGDRLIFLLKEEARSKFEVHLFRGPHGSPHFPDEVLNSPTDEGDKEEYFSALEEFETSSPSLGHPEVELNKAFIKKIWNGKAVPFSHSKHFEKHRMYPGFHKRLTASSIRGSNGDSNAGHFDFPWSFVKTHGNQLHGSVQLQGIHEDSPTYLVTCHWRPQHCLRFQSKHQQTFEVVPGTHTSSNRRRQMEARAHSHVLLLFWNLKHEPI